MVQVTRNISCDKIDNIEDGIVKWNLFYQAQRLRNNDTQADQEKENSLLDKCATKINFVLPKSGDGIEKPKSLSSVSEFTYVRPQKNSSKIHFARLRNYADNLWTGNDTTDIVLIIDKCRFNAHKKVLSCYSPYLKKKLSFIKCKKVKLIGLDPYIMKVLLNYMYTGDLLTTCQTLTDVFKSARKLEMKDVLDKCAEILHGKDKDVMQSNLYCYVAARKLGVVERWMQAQEFILKNFEECIGTEAFLELTCDQLCEILSSDSIGVRSEVEVFIAAIKWLANQDPFQIKNAIAVMSCVRFPLMNRREILHCFYPPIARHVTEIPVVRNMLLRGLCFASAVDLNLQDAFEKFSCSPRQGLVEGEHIHLWDIQTGFELSI